MNDERAHIGSAAAVKKVIWTRISGSLQAARPRGVFHYAWIMLDPISAIGVKLPSAIFGILNIQAFAPYAGFITTRVGRRLGYKLR
jgi:hypothetical protein